MGPSKKDSEEPKPPAQDTLQGTEAGRQTRRWERRRSEILRTAECAFAELGFGATTLENVACRLELRRASLAYYFDDKEALYDGVFREILLEVRERMQPAFDEEDPLTGMETITSVWVDFLQERPDAGRVILRQTVDGLAPRSELTREVFFGLLDGMSNVIGRGVERGQFKRFDAGEFGAMIAGTSLFWFSSQDTLQRGFGFDPLTPENIESLRHRLVQLTRQLLEAPDKKGNQ